MSIRTPQIAARHGALDSTAVANGGAVSAHQFRAVARNANRYVTKPRTVISCWWPLHSITTHGESAGVWHFSGGYAPPAWTLFARWPAAKVDNHRALDLRITMRLAVDLKVDLQIATGAGRFSPTPPTGRLQQVSGTGDWAEVDLDDVPLAPGLSDEVELWIRAASQGDLLNTALYGTPDVLTTISTSLDSVTELTGDWTPSSTPDRDLAEAGHGAYFLDADGNVIAVREIVGLGPPNSLGNLDTLLLAPPFTPNERAAVARQVDTVEIRKLPELDFASIVGVSHAV